MNAELSLQNLWEISFYTLALNHELVLQIISKLVMKCLQENQVVLNLRLVA